MPWFGLGTDSSVVFHKAAIAATVPEENAPFQGFFILGGRDYDRAVKFNTLEHPAGSTGSGLLRHAVPAASLSIFGNSFDPAVDWWPSWPPALQAAMPS